MSSASSNRNSREAYQLRNLDWIAERWDQKADHWEHELDFPQCHLNEDDAYARFLGKAVSIILERRDFCSKHGVLDLGCGTGLVLAHVISFFAWGIGVDISSRMIRQAQAKRIPRAEFRIGDGFQLESLGIKVGAIFSRGILLSHYGPEHAITLLKSAKSVLVQEGILVVDFLNELARGRYSHVAENKTHYSREQVRVLANNAGFESITIMGEDSRRVLLLLAQRTD